MGHYNYFIISTVFLTILSSNYVFNLRTLDEAVSLKHWYSVTDIENLKGYNLKMNPHLREEHIKPEDYQKMNVAIASQVSYFIKAICDSYFCIIKRYISYSFLALQMQFFGAADAM